MESSNFRPLQSHWPRLYEYARFAEIYAHSDPQTAAIKLRCFAAILSFNKKHGNWGWRAIALDASPGASL